MGTSATTPTTAQRMTAAPRAIESRIGKLVTSSGALALVDQSIVSGTSFATTVVVGRYCGAGELGTFTLGMVVLVLLGAFQESLILNPFAVFSNRRPRPPSRRYLGSLVVYQGLLMAIGVVGLAAASAVAWLGSGSPKLATIILVLAGVLPWHSLRVFVRRVLMARLRVGSMLALDVVVVSLQFGGFAYLFTMGLLSAATALIVIGIACGAASLAWFAFTYDRFTLSWRHSRQILRSHWSLGRWICASQLSDMGQRYILHWLLALLIGVVATGIYSAYASLLLVLSPLVLGAMGVLVPHAARAFRDGGNQAVRNVVWKTTALLGSIAGIVCFAAAVIGEWAVQLLYSADYVGYGPVMVVLAASTFVGILSFPADHGLLVLKRTDVNFKAGVLGLTITCLLTIPLAAGLGVLGAAISGLVGIGVTSIIQIAAFNRLSRAANL